MFIKSFYCIVFIVGSARGQASNTAVSDVTEVTDVIESCEDFGNAIMETMNGDVNILMHPFADIECPNFTTFNLTSGNKLTISSSENLEIYHGSSSFSNVRVNVQGGSVLTIENDVVFHSPERDHEDLPDVNGGAFFIGEGSEVRFLNEFKTQYIGVRSQTDESSDFASHANNGGVIYNLGKFVVTGEAIFENSENSGGGESAPGPGGVIYNEGFMLFKGGLEVSDVSILDDEGNNGAIWNSGTVRISGPCKFTRNFAESGGSIYNSEGGKIIFNKGSSVVFNDVSASDGVGGAIFNNGYMRFRGPALFVEGRSYYEGGAVVVGKTGSMKMSKNTVFFGNRSGTSGAPVHVRTGGSFEFNEKKTYFISNVGDGFDATCPTVYFEDGEVCF